MNVYKWIFLLVLFILLVIVFYSLDNYFYKMKDGFLVGTTGVEEVCTKGQPNSVGCYDISYIDPVTNTTNQIYAKITPGFYIDASGYLAPVPFGYIGSTDMRSYVPIPKLQMDSSVNYVILDETENKTSNKEYNSDNYDITYHADPMKDIDMNPSASGVGKTWIEMSGNIVSVPYSDVLNTTLYNPPGTYKFNSASYVPNYEESVYLSNASHPSVSPKLYKPNAEKTNYNVCLTTEHSLMERDARCNALDKRICMETNCCVVLGGEKCVAGDKTGPTNKSHYSDRMIINRDFYYYRNKCYGNCK